MSFLQRRPQRPPNFHTHLRRDQAQSSRGIAEEEETHDLEHTFATSPRTHIEILDVRQLSHELSLKPGFFADFSFRRLLWDLPRIHRTFWQREYSAGGSRTSASCHFVGIDGVRFNDCHMPLSLHSAKHHAASRDFTNRFWFRLSQDHIMFAEREP